MSVLIRLTDQQWSTSLEFGRRRYEANRATPDAHGRVGKSAKDEAEACAAELAVAVFLDVYWDPIADRPHKQGDVGNVDVRSTPRRDGRLILHAGDVDDRPYVLVVGEGLERYLIGWITGRDGKRRAWWTDPGTGRPAFFVPQAALWPMSQLKQGLWVAKTRELYGPEAA